MIFVFRTSVQTTGEMRQLKPHLDQSLPGAKWNFDLDDCDKILRIESLKNIVPQTIDLLKIHSFDCEELQ